MFTDELCDGSAAYHRISAGRIGGDPFPRTGPSLWLRGLTPEAVVVQHIRHSLRVPGAKALLFGWRCYLLSPGTNDASKLTVDCHPKLT
jgi:hypothetical protein